MGRSSPGVGVVAERGEEVTAVRDGRERGVVRGGGKDQVRVFVCGVAVDVMVVVVVGEEGRGWRERASSMNSSAELGTAVWREKKREREREHQSWIKTRKLAFRVRGTLNIYWYMPPLIILAM